VLGDLDDAMQAVDKSTEATKKNDCRRVCPGVDGAYGTGADVFAALGEFAADSVWWTYSARSWN
jgi:hypothetical protein